MIKLKIREKLQLPGKKKDLSFILFAFLFVATLLLIQYIREEAIETNSVYVLGIIKHKEWLSNGSLYECEYQYGSKTYKATFSDIRQSEDSLVFLKISKLRPESWIWQQSKVVPKCIEPQNSPLYGWDTIPGCENRDK